MAATRLHDDSLATATAPAPGKHPKGQLRRRGKSKVFSPSLYVHNMLQHSLDSWVSIHVRPLSFLGK